MQRTKWMRLAMRDLGDVIRWAGAQNAREIGEFRYRVVNGREMVSFRLVPRYAVIHVQGRVPAGEMDIATSP